MRKLLNWFLRRPYQPPLYAYAPVSPDKFVDFDCVRRSPEAIETVFHYGQKWMKEAGWTIKKIKIEILE